MGVVVGRLVRGVGVGGGGTYMACGYGAFLFVLFYVGMDCGGFWGKVEDVCVGGGVPRFALEDVALVCVRRLYICGSCVSVGSGWFTLVGEDAWLKSYGVLARDRRVGWECVDGGLF